MNVYSSKSNFGYGLFYYNDSSGDDLKEYDGLQLSEVGEKTRFHYIAPQFSWVKRQAGFHDGLLYINAGIGYAHYKSEGMLLQNENYRTAQSGIGCNVAVGYEYAFMPNIGIRLSAGCVYARIKGLHDGKASYPEELSILPRFKSHLFTPLLELGLSCYFLRW